jgi:glycosyltransferase involved in cell wall biosynthesis
VCLIIPGGIGTGKMNIGVPVLEALVKLLAEDVDLTVLSLFRINDDYIPRGFTLVSIPYRNALLKTFRALWLFRRLHRQQQFDIIHGYWVLPSGFLSVIIGRMFNVRIVVSILGGDAASIPSIRYGQLRSDLQRKLVLWTLNHADERTALSQFSIDNLTGAGLKKPIRIIPWGVEPNQFFMKEKAMGKPVQFLHVANLTLVKDQATLLKAFQLISQKTEARLTIIGEGPEEAALRLMAVSLGIRERVTILGPQPYELLPGYYHQSDVLLHTSLSEGQSEVVTEAMSCGLLVCGTRVGLMADIQDACVTVPIGDYRALAESVMGLLGDQRAMNDIRRKALEWSLTHPIRWTADRILELYTPNQ